MSFTFFFHILQKFVRQIDIFTSGTITTTVATTTAIQTMRHHTVSYTL